MPWRTSFTSGLALSASRTHQTSLFGATSHALMLAPIAEWAAQAAQGAAVILGKTSCPPLLGVEVDFFVARTCAASNDELLRWFQKQHGQAITGVVLGARWLLYSGHDTPAGDAELPRLLWRDSDRASSGYADILDRGLTDMLKAISPSHRVLIVGPVPELEHPPADCLMRAQTQPENRANPACSIGARSSNETQKQSLYSSALRPRFPNVRLIDPLDAFCDHDKCAPFGPHGRLLSRHRSPHPTRRRVALPSFRSAISSGSSVKQMEK